MLLGGLAGGRDVVGGDGVGDAHVDRDHALPLVAKPVGGGAGFPVLAHPGRGHQLEHARDHRQRDHVPGCAEDRPVKLGVVGKPALDRPALRGEAVELGADRLHVGRCRDLGRPGDRGHLEPAAHLAQPDHARPVEREDQLERVGEQPVGVGRYVHAAATVDLDEAERRQDPQRLADRRPARLEAQGEVAFGRQPAARLDPALHDQGAQLVDDEVARAARGRVAQAHDLGEVASLHGGIVQRLSTVLPRLCGHGREYLRRWEGAHCGGSRGITSVARRRCAPPRPPGPG